MPLRRASIALLVVALALVAIAVGVVANQRSARAEQRERAEVLAGGDAGHGAALFAARGCGGCHTLRGAAQASGKV